MTTKNVTAFSSSYLLIVILMMLSAVSSQASAAGIQGERTYLRLAQGKESEEHDLDIVSIGSLALNGDRMGHVDITRIESLKNGDAYTLDFGGGYNYQGLYFSFGIALGHNSDTSDNFVAYYPEVGIALDITNELAATISAKRYHNLYREDEQIVVIGLLVRQ